MALQPDARTDIDRATTAPFLLRLYWRQTRSFDSWEFSIAPPADTTGIADYSSLLPSAIRQQSVQIYTWPNCTLGELTSLFTSVLPPNVLPSPAVGTRLIFKLIFPDTRATVVEGNRGKWIEKPLGSVIIGGQNGDADGDEDMNGVGEADNLEGDALKTLADARFVIGDYVVCSIYPPGSDGRIADYPARGGRPAPSFDGYGGGSRGGPPPRRENGFGESGYGRGGYRGGYGGRGGGRSMGAAPPPGDWNRGERPPPSNDYYDAPRRGGGGGYYGRGGRPY